MPTNRVKTTQPIPLAVPVVSQCLIFAFGAGRVTRMLNEYRREFV